MEGIGTRTRFVSQFKFPIEKWSKFAILSARAHLVYILSRENLVMYSNSKIRKNHLLIIVVLSSLLLSSALINNGHYGVTNVVYGQTNTTQQEINSSHTNPNLVNLQDIPLEKVRVGDIDIAYKMFGKGDPIILLNGASDGLDAWDPALLTVISTNHSVIAFDQRGIGNSTVGSQFYTHQQLANDTAGLLDALNISKADVVGLSLGSYLAQQFTIMHPDKVNSLTLVGSSCGGKDHTPKPAEFIRLQSEIVNKSLNNISLSTDELRELIAASLGSGWVKLHPESVDVPANITSLQQLKPGLPPEIADSQNKVGKYWEDNPQWSGTCDELATLDKPTLVITGIDDIKYQPYVNSLKIVEKIPGAWLVQIKNAGHAVMDQYPEEVGMILNTFLSTIK
jgi:pimeloyl-ACP methyl ester carboxylesterase